MSRNRVKKAVGSREEPTNLEKFLPGGFLDRRSRIIRAVCRLIEERGAMSTSVSDIAREAKMTVPHLLYYFRNKEALLDEVFNSFSASLLSRITSDWSANLSAEEQCQLLADNMFLESAQPALDEAIIFEMIAYAVHSRGFKRTQQKHTERVINYLRRFFEQTPRTGFSAEESAVLVSSLWIGTMVVSFFHQSMTRRQARELFRRAIRHLAGIEDRAPTEKPGQGKARLGKSRPLRRRGYQMEERVT